MIAGDQLATFVLAAFVLGITPGPDILYVIARGAAQGPKAGLAATAGLATGIVGHSLLAAAGLSAVLATSATAFTVIKFLGAGYLIYLGLRMWMRRGRLALPTDGSRRALAEIYRQTIVMNLLNPKVALFFLAFLPQFVQPSAGAATLQFLLLGLIFMAVSALVMGTAAVLGGQLRRLLDRRPGAGQAIEGLAGAVLVGLGLSLAFQKAG